MTEAKPSRPQVSRLPGLYRLSVAERRRRVEDACGLASGALDRLDVGLSLQAADSLVENVLGTHALPFAVATNFRVDARDVLVPMVIEEPSVVAAASNAARMARAGGGFETEADAPIALAQVELLDVPDRGSASLAIRESDQEVADRCRELQPRLHALGGGFRGLEVRELADPTRLVVHLRVDCRDAMGANIANTLAEAIAPRLAVLSGGRVGLRILSNLADSRRVRARCRIPVDALERPGASGERVRDGVVAATRFAELDPYRAATHNKGILNGIDAVALATGNDWRGVEAGAHAYAARSGQYRPLSAWSIGEDGALAGELEMPLAVGVVGGATRILPSATLARELLGVSDADGLARIMAAVGLGQNLAALAALSTEGIQHGHMALHARSRGQEK